MKLDKLNIGIIGATGAVGAQALKLLSKRKHPIQKIFAFASKKSVGKKINYLGREYLSKNVILPNVQQKGNIELLNQEYY